MHSYHFAKSFIERGKRRFCSGTACCRFVGCVAAGRVSIATAISTRFWQWSSVRCGCLGRNTKCCKLRIRPSNSTSTPKRHDGFFSLSYIFCAICGSSCFLFEESIFIAYYRVRCYTFFSVSAGQHSKPRPCLLGLRGMYYRLCAVVYFIIFLLSLYLKLALPLCSRIVWDYLCRGGLRAG